MLDFRPFYGWRYDVQQVALEKVIAPPYDVISPSEQADLYARSEFNCVRLILNREESSDDETTNRYTRARDFFEQWQREGVLLREPKPAFYLYRQRFKSLKGEGQKERFAILGRLKLEPFEEGHVIPHEKTLSKPREDRRRLLEATRANFSPVFGLYEDAHQKIAPLIQKLQHGKPVFDIEDGEGIRHALWVLTDETLLQTIQDLFKKEKVYLADGHHRYQTALAYALRHREVVPNTGEHASDFVLMALVCFGDPGLELLPTHRLLRPWPAFERDRMLEALRPYFSVEQASLEAIQAATGSISMGLFFADGQYLITLKETSNFRDLMPVGKPDVWYRLNVNILAHLILSALWNLPEDQGETTLQFTHSDEEFLRKVRSGDYAAGFWLHAPPVEVLLKMGNAGALMPQKSTYFYPKLASGIVFYSHD